MSNQELEIKGQIISGGFAEIAIRQKSDQKLQIGDLLVVDEENGYIILQIYDLKYESQIPEQSRELIAGLKLEGYGENINVFEPELRNYIIATAKSLVHVEKRQDKLVPVTPKELPSFFKKIRLIGKQDLAFLTKPNNPVFLGNLRSGSKVFKDIEIYLDGKDMIPHHTLISATTGRGKSNFMKTMLWNLVGNKKFGLLVLDPHDEYYGRTGEGLRRHPKVKENVLYFTPKPIPGDPNSKGLLINLSSLNPTQFNGIMEFSEPQWRALSNLQEEYHENWIEQLFKLKNEELAEKKIDLRTANALRGMFGAHLGISLHNAVLVSRNKVFTQGQTGQSTLINIVNEVEKGKIVIIDTSLLQDTVELLIGSMITQRLFHNYQQYKFDGILDSKPYLGIVIEEAPRVIGTEAIGNSENIYSTIAKEGRKFNTGLIAITQLTSVIPHTILANMNTKIILGNELKTERDAIINSACQDLSTDQRTIASLDKGEAIITSNFARFAVPVKFPLFEEFVKEELEKANKAASEEEPHSLDI